MPVIHRKNINDESAVAVWDITEPLPDLISLAGMEEEDPAKLAGFRDDNRKAQWLCANILLQDLLKDKSTRIEYTEYGKPFIPESPYRISISHSYNYAAVLIHKNNDCGVDIEKLKYRIVDTSSRFMTFEERQGLHPQLLPEHIHVIWGAKESLYKLYGKRELDFREHIRIQPFEYSGTCGTFTGIINKENYHNSFTVHYEKLNNYMLVYTML